MLFASEILSINYTGVAAGVIAAAAGVALVISAVAGVSYTGRERIVTPKRRDAVSKYKKKNTLRYKSKIKIK